MRAKSSEIGAILRSSAFSSRGSRRSVPADRLRVRPRAARRSVPAADVAETPADLGRGVRLPVRARASHLASGQRLRDAVGAAAGVVGAVVPAGLLVPQRDEAGELVAAPAVAREHSA